MSTIVADFAVASGADELVFHFKHRVDLFPDRYGPKPLPPNLKNVRVEVYSQPRNNPSCSVGNRTYLDGPHIGVVLSGGVSKGLAFIGALQFLDDVGIRIDGIVGTSMGAVVGSFYAAGYSPRAIYSPPAKRSVFGTRPRQYTVLEEVDWRLIFTDIPPESTLTYSKQTAWGLGEGNNFLPRAYQGGLKSGQNVITFLNKILLPATAASSGCFDNLYVPFRAVASNILDARAHYFRYGNLANAVRASLAYPALFTPVFIDGVRYRDGGLLRNYPVDGIDDFSPNDARRKFDVILGFDVSDTKVPSLREASVFPILSFYDALLGVGDGLNAAITRETELQKRRRKCTSAADVNEAFSKERCLIDTKIEVEGGFLDFNEDKFREFNDKGVERTRSVLCALFEPAECTPQNLREKIKAQAPALLFDPEVNLRDALETLGTKKRADVAGRFDALLEAYRRAVGTLVFEESDHDDTLQGLEIRYRPSGIEAYGDPVILRDEALRQALLRDLETILYWLSATAKGKHVDPDRYLGQYFRDISSLKIIVRSEEIVVRASSWRYEMRRFALLSDFTERDALDEAAVALWDHSPEDIKKVRSRLESNYAGDSGLDIKESGGSLSASKKGSRHSVREPGRLKTELYAGMAGRRFDVRYFASHESCFEPIATGEQGRAAICSLPEVAVKQINRYYSIGSTEYVRVEEISRDSVWFAEKRNMESPWGSLYFNYQYDFDNKHTYILKHSKFSRDSRFHTLTNAAVNDPTGDPAGMRYLDTTVTYFRSIDPGKLPSDVSVNPYLAHRVVRFPSDERPRRLDYNARGIKVTLSAANDGTGDRAAGSPARLGITGFMQADWRELTRISSDDRPFVSRLLNDPSLLSDETQRFTSYRAGIQYYAPRFFQPFRVGVAYHDSARGGMWELFAKLNVQVGPVEVIALGGRVGDRWSLKGGSVEASAPPPVDEIYSIGGFYPLREDRFWGGKRLDFIGANLNERWGTSAFYTSFRFDVCRFSVCDFFRSLSLFSPGSKFRFDLVFDLAQVGFSAEEFKETSFAKGLSFSAYLPVMATLQPKFNVALGWESWDDRKFFSSVDIVF